MGVLSDLVYLLDPRNDTEPLRINEGVSSITKDEQKNFIKAEVKGIFQYALGFSKPVLRSGIAGLCCGGLLYLMGEDFKVNAFGASHFFYSIDSIQYNLRGAYQLLTNLKNRPRVI